jgi:hypothetical protein
MQPESTTKAQETWQMCRPDVFTETQRVRRPGRADSDKFKSEYVHSDTFQSEYVHLDKFQLEYVHSDKFQSEYVHSEKFQSDLSPRPLRHA